MAIADLEVAIQSGAKQCKDCFQKTARVPSDKRKRQLSDGKTTENSAMAAKRDDSWDII